MSRVTIEDCIVKVGSHFDLALIAAKRARQLARGAEAKLPWDGHKSTVLALREIAQGHVTADVLKEVELPVIKSPDAQLQALDPFEDYLS